MSRSRYDFSEGEWVCHWCKRPCPYTKARSPIEGIPGALWIVCGADCPDRPEGVQVGKRPEWRVAS